jgi:hypothetical protein
MFYRVDYALAVLLLGFFAGVLFSSAPKAITPSRLARESRGAGLPLNSAEADLGWHIFQLVRLRLKPHRGPGTRDNMIASSLSSIPFMSSKIWAVSYRWE